MQCVSGQAAKGMSHPSACGEGPVAQADTPGHLQGAASYTGISAAHLGREAAL